MFRKTIQKVVVIGGGTGNFAVLQALKNEKCDITVLVNMADDGGSTGVLRDELGILPPGDVRQCLVALSEASDELRALFTYRFPDGSSLSGHSFGNLFLSAVEKMNNNFEDAIRMASDVLRIKGRVLPVTLQNSKLVLDMNGEKIIGQHTITKIDIKSHQRPKLSLEPEALLLPDAASAISDADLIVIAPGNLYASLAPALLVRGMKEALQASKAKLAFVCNLVNKPTSTDEYDVYDYSQEIERFIGEGRLDYVLYNIDRPSPKLLEKYALEGESPVKVNTARLQRSHYKPIAGKFLSHAEIASDPNDTLLKRSLIRHDGQAVATALMALL